MKEYFVVTANGGEWEDSWEYITGIFENEKEACDQANEIFKEYVKEKIISDEVYEQHIDEFYSDTELDNEDYNYEPIFKDAYGFTSVQWEKAYDARNFHTDFSFMKVNAYKEKCGEFRTILTLSNNKF